MATRRLSLQRSETSSGGRYQNGDSSLQSTRKYIAAHSDGRETRATSEPIDLTEGVSCFISALEINRQGRDALSVAAVFSRLADGSVGPNPDRPIPVEFNGRSLLEFELGQDEPMPPPAEPADDLGDGSGRVSAGPTGNGAAAGAGPTGNGTVLAATAMASLVDCSKVGTGGYCNSCEAGPGSTCKGPAGGKHGACGTCAQSACLMSPSYGTHYDKECPL